MSDYFKNCSEIGIIEHLKECADHYNFNYDGVLLSECYVSLINSAKKIHITHRIDEQDNLITFLLNSNDINKLFNCENIYFYSQEDIMTILKGYARA